MKSIGIKTAVALTGAILAPAFAQTRGVQQRIDVQDYAIDLTVDPQSQTLKAVAKVNFTAVDNVAEVSFDLNNALNLDKVTGDDGRRVVALFQAIYQSSREGRPVKPG